MSYLLIDKKIVDYKTGKNKNEDIYMFAYITLCDKERTGEVYAREDTLSQNTGIPLRTVQSIISRLKLNPDLIQIETKQKDMIRERITTRSIAIQITTTS